MITAVEIKTVLDALGTLGPLAVGSIPASPDVQGVINEYGGQAVERGFGVSGIKYENPALQIVFRGDPFDYSGPATRARIAWVYLPTIGPGALGGGITTEYLMLDPQQSPFPIMPVDANKRVYIGFNIYIKKVPS